MIKVHLPKNSIVLYYGEPYVTNFEYWTTIKDIQHMKVAVKNIMVKMAKTEFFVKYVGQWPNITIGKQDLEILNC